MNNFKYKCFAFIFNFFRLFAIDNKRISFILPHNDNFDGNIKYIYNELNSRDNFKYNFIFYSNNKSMFKNAMNLLKIFTIKAYYLATSKYIFLNDNFFPMAFMNINPDSSVIQLWHAVGAFKKFGLSSNTDKNSIEIEKKISKKMNLIPVSSKNISIFYQEAFGVPKDKVVPLGVPRTDYYFENHDINKFKNKFYENYPEARNKKIVLYAPTFRKDSGESKNIIENFDFESFEKILGNEYFLALKLHPKFGNNFKNNNNYNNNYNNFVDLTDFKDEKELLLISDILITDYSSIMIEFALLKKTIIFFPYDYKEYNFNDRGFYVDYLSVVPGIIVYNNEDLIKAVKEGYYDEDKVDSFLKFQCDAINGNSSRKIVDYILCQNS